MRGALRGSRQEESFDHLIRSAEQFAVIQQYIARNPHHLNHDEFFLYQPAVVTGTLRVPVTYEDLHCPVAVSMPAWAPLRTGHMAGPRGLNTVVPDRQSRRSWIDGSGYFDRQAKVGGRRWQTPLIVTSLRGHLDGENG